MPEELNTGAAQTSEQGSQADTNAAVGQSESVNDASFSDHAAEGAAGAASQQKTEPQRQTAPQSREQNAENARRRREQERQREIESVRNRTIIDTLGGKNPYTGGEMKDAEDVREYLEMREIEKRGGDPVGDFSRHVKEKRREQQERAQRDEEKRVWYENDRAAFVAKYPDVDLRALVQNQSFRDFSDGKVGVKPLGEIYESYLAMTGSIEREAKRSAAQSFANAAASPGALSGGGQVHSDFITKEQVQSHRGDAKWMDQNYDAIRRSMAKW